MGNNTAIISLEHKIDELNREAWEARVNDSPRALELSQESIQLSRDINYPRGLAEGLRSLGFAYVRLYKNDQAAPLLRESLALFQSLKDLRGQAIVYEYLGIIERNWGNLGTSLEFLLKALELVQQTGPLEVEITSSYQLGVTYKHLGNYDSALDYLYRSLSLAKNINLSLMEAYAINIIGSIYFDNGDYPQALDCYRQGLMVRQQSNDKWGEAGSLDNIGFVYLKLNDLEKAADYCRQSLSISQATGDKKGEANSLLHLAEIFGQAGDINQALKFSGESLEIRKARGDKRGEGEALLFLAGLHQKYDHSGDHVRFECLSRALSIANEIKAQDLLSKAHFDLHEYYRLTANYEQALEQLGAHLQIEKELHRNTISQKVSNLEITHKAEAISQRNKELTELNEQIEKANAELRIEASLERVRAVAMGMSEPNDMLEICRTISEQLQMLGIAGIRNVQTAIFDQGTTHYLNYEFFRLHDKKVVTEVDYALQPDVAAFVNRMRSDPEAFYTRTFKDDELTGWIMYQQKSNQFVDPHLYEVSSVHYYFFSIGPGALGISAYAPVSEHGIQLLRRFRNVFELAYRRFIDIRQAQESAREALIEAALERIRSSTMAMQTSNDLLNVVAVVKEQLLQLGFEVDAVSFITDFSDSGYNMWLSSPGEKVLSKIYVPRVDYRGTTLLNTAIRDGHDFVSYVLSKEEKDIYFRNFLENTSLKNSPEESKQEIYDAPGIATSIVILESILLTVGNFKAIGYTDDENAIIRRFGYVFEQSYIRFLDLQKAEAQAREAQIQLALERVRARTMAMHNSEELADVIKLVYQEFDKLNINNESTDIEIGLIDEETGVASVWAHFYLSDGTISTFKFPFTHFEEISIEFNKWKATPVDKRKELFFTSEFSGELLQKFTQKADELPELAEIFRPLKEAKISKWVTHNAYFSHGILTLQGTEAYSPGTLEIQKRFARVFEQTYTRFLDLQKAEAQAREAKIEAALEKIRSRSLAMHQSTELKEVITITFEKLSELNVLPGTVAIQLFDKSSKNCYAWVGNAIQAPQMVNMPYDEKLEGTLLKDSWQAMTDGVDIINKEYSFEQKNKYFDHLFSNNDLTQIPERAREVLKQMQRHIVCFFTERNSAFLVDSWNGELFSKENQNVIKRAASVFDQAYIRFLDLQKAEAQAREAQIEAALERVRSRTMAMQKPQELDSVIKTVYAELKQLDVTFIRCFIMIFDEQKGATWWMGSPDDDLFHEGFYVQYHTHPPHLAYLKGWEERQQKWEYLLGGQIKKDWDEFVFNKTELSKLPPIAIQHMMSFEFAYLAASFENFGCITTGGGQPLSEESYNVLGRFTKVFEQTYTRFLDLQKAEAQAREAMIEAALERVRSRTMGMQKSEELKEVIQVVYEQLVHLKINLDHAGFVVDYKPKGDWHFWIADKQEIPSKITHPYFDSVWANQFNEAKEKGNDLFTTNLNFEEKNKFYRELLSYVPGLPEASKSFYFTCPGVAASTALFDNVSLYIENFSGIPYTNEENTVLMRFGKVFQQTYRRFLDLQKAEAQAREAQIETGLERVRSKTMAMHKSEEVTGVAVSLNEELIKLGFQGGSTIIIINKETGDTEQWTGFSQDKTLRSCNVPYFDHPFHHALLDAWKKGERFLVYTVAGEEKTSLDEHYFSTGYKIFPENDQQWMKKMESVTFSHAFMKYGAIHWGPYHLAEEQLQILSRFAKVFEQSYTRFLDLQKAEAQAREAQIEAALEKVRAKVMGMTTSNDLNETSLVFGEQLRKLGIDWQFSYFWLIEEEKDENTFWITWPDSKTSITIYTLREAEQYFNECLVSWKAGVKIHDNYVPPADAQAWLDTFQRIADDAGGVANKVMTPQNFSNGVFYYDAMMKYGSFGICINKPATDEEKNIQCRFAVEFERAYTRFNDLKLAEQMASQAELDLIKLKEEKKRTEDALAELQVTQKQLIQTEKMASLGELTAGIAHEIQNPLNFVNNFSDVSNELIDEMKQELEAGNTEQAIQIINDVKDNLEKILHHGKRADGIVKGMLQHSRSSSGKKEPTDINALAEEYFRLAYHGLRAKDKSFNAKFEANLDQDIGKINIVPQEMGRVILNLINNAFYAVNEKKSGDGDGFVPQVVLTTKKIGDTIEIRVKDNGDGIPQKVLDKIFQPFFTTKPAGAGTGLGLSLSYDIVTKGHGGELDVWTQEGEGAEFIISLPVN